MHDQIERKRQTREAHRVTQNGGWALNEPIVRGHFIQADIWANMCSASMYVDLT